jgi:hypothetical protein
MITVVWICCYGSMKENENCSIVMILEFWKYCSYGVHKVLHIFGFFAGFDSKNEGEIIFLVFVLIEGPN